MHESKHFLPGQFVHSESTMFIKSYKIVQGFVLSSLYLLYNSLQKEDKASKVTLQQLFQLILEVFLSLFWTMFIYTELYDWLVDDLGQVFTKLAVADLVNGAEFGNVITFFVYYSQDVNYWWIIYL